MIDDRVEAMLRAGWVEEVRALINQGVPANAKAFQFIGYSELRACIEGGRKIEEARGQIQQATRRFAKRQLTWFRKEPDVHWLSGFGDDPDVIAGAMEMVPEAHA